MRGGTAVAATLRRPQRPPAAQQAQSLTRVIVAVARDRHTRGVHRSISHAQTLTRQPGRLARDQFSFPRFSAAMSQDQLLQLLQQIQADPELMAQFQSAASLAEAKLIAQQAGFEVSEQDWFDYQSRDARELSDTELEGVSGGAEKGWKSIRGKNAVVQISGEDVELIC